MKFALFNYPSVPASFPEREKLRPIGRNRERYREMLHEVREYCVLADELGFDAYGTTEHHLHSEGMELSAGCMLYYADLAARTKRIKFMPMAVVLPSNNPLRVAVELAVLDQLSDGRVLPGFARGYQDRWMNIFGQHAGVKGSPMDGSDTDLRNREVFNEYRDIIYKAWTEELLTYDGKFMQIPYPYEEGITRWPAAPFTAKYGTPGEVDENGVVRGVSVCPVPYQDPFPEPAFQPFSVSESTIKTTARNGTIPLILTCWPSDFRALCETYRDLAAEAGRDLKLGESVGAMRPVAFGDTTQEAIDRMERNNMRAYKEYFGPFGYFEICRYPEDEEEYPEMLPEEEKTIERYIGTHFGLAGTPDEVKRKFEELQKIHGDDGELEWFVWFFDQGHMPLDEGKRQMELYAEHILSEFSDTKAPAVA
jgi:alkanesulfonate monooxygenase SsuD/methylene tetrahydromethanopterin reductase-like flavin-dependent oxidoreductase (luciferase family)